MLVLFTGGRGSGKSTIARALYGKLRESGVKFITQSSWRKKSRHVVSKALSIMYFLMFFRPSLCGVYLQRLYRDIKSGRARGGLSRLYMPCIFSYHLKSLSRRADLCVVYDSDFATFAADKVLDGCFDEREVEKYFNRRVLPLVGQLLLVVCDTPVELAVERWRDRDNQVLTLAEINEWVRNRTSWKQARQRVIDVIGPLAGVTVIKLDGAQTVDSNVEIIFKSLSNSSTSDTANNIE
ncbi:MAG TPA: hypothetical protein QF720_04545 [Nitrospinota bacterium]|nr:hypothetical protein [Nitrospinota bacterium]